MRTSSLRSAVFLSGAIGLLVAIFAAAEYFQASLRSACTINQFFSCATVDRSGLTTTLGVPDYLWGIAGFLALLVVAAIAEKRPHDVRPAYALALLATGGVALSAYFLYVQLARIHALCLVCATAETFGVILWLSSIELARRTGPGAGPDPDARRSPPVSAEGDG